jgi:hypothetical protein
MANTIPANNNTGLYNTVTGNATPINANVYATNVFASGFVSAAGNIYTSGFYFGDGSQLTNLPPSPSTYGNSNVTTLLAGFGSNTVSTTGNVSAGYFVGNGSLLTGVVTSSYGNANVAAFLPTYTGALAGANISVTGNITGGNLNISGNITDSVGVLQLNSVGNINLAPTSTVTVAGAVSATGNITGNYILGNGSQLTGLPATYGNSNVSTYLASGTNSNNIVTGGNVQGGSLITSGAAGNIVGANYVSASYFVGDGSLLTNVVATSSYSNSNVTTLLASFGSNTVSTTGNISAGYFVGNGSQLTGITSTYGNANVNTLLNAWGSNALSTTGNVTASYVAGNGSLLSSLTGANVTGTVANATYATSAGTATSATTAGTVTTAAQANITSVGTLSSLSVAGNITTGGIKTDGYYYANGTPFTGGGGSTYGNSNVNTLLAAWGSNTLSTTGTVNAGNITGGNVLTGGIVSATGNIRGGNILTAGDISATGGIFNTGNIAGGNISTTGQFSAQGNVVGGNLNTAGQVVAAGNITGGNLLSSGQLSVGGAITAVSVGASGLVQGGTINSPGAVTGGSFSTAGNVTAGNLIVSGIVVDQVGNLDLQSTATNGNINFIINGTGRVTANSTISAGAVTYTNVDGTTGQVLTTYGNGITYFSTVSGGSGSPGGANTQIQYNNANAFAGNSAMTFNNTTGNITLGNIVTNTNQIQTVGAIDLANANVYGTTTPWRVLLGNAYNGSANSIYAPTGPAALNNPSGSARLLVSDLQTAPNTGLRVIEQSNQLWVNLSANISNTNTRINAVRNDMMVGGGTNNYNITATNNTSLATVVSTNGWLGAGTNANLSLVGNTVLSAGIMGTYSSVTVNNYSTANVITGYHSSLSTNNANTTAFGNATTQLAYSCQFQGTPANANITGTTTAIGYYVPGPATVIPGTFGSGNIARQATDYYSFRSDDTLAKAQLGSLSSFNEYTANVTSSAGAVTVNKNNGQVQQIYPTENITSITFSNFVTRVQKPDSTYVNQSDTVTLIIQQGATGRTVTMPSGTAYRYAGGANIVGSTANTTTMISITGTYNYNTAADQYLITISPEFS